MNGFEKRFAKMQFGGKERTMLYEQIVSLLKSGMTRRDALKTAWIIAAKDGTKPKEGIAMILADVIRRLENGLTFGEAMAPWAPQDDVMVLNAIEDSTDFAASLENYIELDKRRRAMLSKVTGGMMYPAALVFAAYFLVIYFGKNVMPQLNDVYPMEKWAGPAYNLKLMAVFAENYVVPASIFFVTLFVAVAWSLPRWGGFGRRIADKLPIYNIYKAYTGVNFLVAMAALTGGGMKVIDAVDKIIPKSSPYVQKRLRMTKQGILSGKNLGQALYDTKTDWPDAAINLNLKVFAQTQDLSASMDKISRDSLSKTEKKMDKTLGSLRFGAMMLVFGVLISVMTGIFGLQSQLGSEMSF